MLPFNKYAHCPVSVMRTHVLRMSSIEECKEFLGRVRTLGDSQELADFYSEWADKYDRVTTTHFDTRAPQNVAQRMMELLGDRKGAKILDLGAGTGRVGGILHEHGYRNLDALDSSVEMLEHAQAKGIYTRLVCDFLGTNKLDIPEATYDGIVLSGVFSAGHANDSCFEEVIRIMKPGAFFVFMIKENYLALPDFKDRFVPRIQTLSDRGLWRVVSCERREYAKAVHEDWSFGLIYSTQKQYYADENIMQATPT